MACLAALPFARGLSGCRCSSLSRLACAGFLPPPGLFASRSSLSCSCGLTCFPVFAFALALAFTGRHACNVTGFSRFACVGWFPCFSWLARSRWLAFWFASRLRNLPSLRLLFLWLFFLFFFLRAKRERRERETAN